MASLLGYIGNTGSNKSKGSGRSFAIFGIRSKLEVNMADIKIGDWFCEIIENLYDLKTSM